MSALNDNTNLPPTTLSSHSNFSLLSMLSREKVMGPGYLDWIRTFRITLRYKNKQYVLDEDTTELLDDATEEQVATYYKNYDESNKFYCLIIANMTSKLQKEFDNVGAYDINYPLMKMFKNKQDKNY